MSAAESDSENELSEKSTYDVERIIARRTRKGRTEYKIKWENFPMSQCTWEPMKNLENVRYLVDEYNNDHPPKNKKKTFLSKKRKLSDKNKECSDKNSDKFEKSVKKAEKNTKKNEKNGKSENASKKLEKNSKKNENYKKDENNSKKIEISSKKTESSSKKDENENGSKSSSKKSDEISNSSSKKSSHLSKSSPNNLKKKSKSSSKMSSLDDTPLGVEYKKNTFIVDERLKKVITVQIRQGRLVAVVDKIDKDETFRNNIPTEDLRKMNPWILLDFYESKIKFN